MAESPKSQQSIEGANTSKALIGDDVPLQIWRDISVTPWAVLLCVHGLSLHSKSFESFGKAMSHLGIPTYAMDVRGFGSWQNTDEGAKLDFADTFKDIKNTLQAIRRGNPGLPVIIVGESMGGALALQATAMFPNLVDGLVCSVPAKQNNGQKSTSMKAAVGLVYFPNLPLKVGEKVIKAATQEDKVAEEWGNDPMARKNFTPRDLLRFRNLMASNTVRAAQIKNTPVLFLQGGSDKLIKPSGTVNLFNHLKTTDKDLVMVGTAQHLILEQGEFDDSHLIKDNVIGLVSGWIDKHVANPESAAVDANGKSAESDDDKTRIARGHFKIAEGMLLLNDAEGARDHLTAVLRIAHGSALAQKADTLLLSLPENVIAPPVGSPVKHDNAKLVSLNAAKSNDKPSILIFCAPWIEPCKTVIDDMNKALGEDTDKVNVVYIDADKEENQAILDEYGVKPLPSVLYLNYKNEVILYTLGYPGETVTRARIRRLLSEDAKVQEQDKTTSK